MDLSFTADEKALLLSSARESVSARLEKRHLPVPEPSGKLAEPHGAFVTLHTQAGGLRGCIGVIIGKVPLLETVREMALASAFQDPRFSPVTLEELSSLIFEISVLSPMREAVPENVVPGTHGILIKKDYRSGLLLPQVAVEQGWNREEFLTHGCFKAGLPGSAWRDKDVHLFIFNALVFREDTN